MCSERPLRESLTTGFQGGQTSSSKEAELKAVLWTAKILNRSWEEVLWNSNAINVAYDINGSHEPVGWHTRLPMLECRSLFSKNNWIITWSARSSNGVVDAIAKKTLNTGTEFMFNVSDGDAFPFCFTNFIMEDLKEARLVSNFPLWAFCA